MTKHTFYGRRRDVTLNDKIVPLYVKAEIMCFAQRPNTGASVKLRYEAHLMDGTLFDERKEGDELEVVMEEGAPHDHDLPRPVDF